MANIKLHGFYGISIPMVLANPKVIVNEIINQVNSYDSAILLNSLYIEATILKESLENIALSGVSQKLERYLNIDVNDDADLARRHHIAIQKLRRLELLNTKVLDVQSREYKNFIKVLSAIIRASFKISNEANSISSNDAFDGTNMFAGSEDTDLSVDTPMLSLDSETPSLEMSESLEIPDDSDLNMDLDLDLDENKDPNSGSELSLDLDLDIDVSSIMNSNDSGFELDINEFEFTNTSEFSSDNSVNNSATFDAIILEAEKLIKMIEKMYSSQIFEYINSTSNQASNQSRSISRLRRARAPVSESNTVSGLISELESLVVFAPLENDFSKSDTVMLQFDKIARMIDSYGGSEFSILSDFEGFGIESFKESFKDENMNWQNLTISTISNRIRGIDSNTNLVFDPKGNRLNKDNLIRFVIPHIFNRVATITLNTDSELTKLVASSCFKHTTLSKEVATILNRNYGSYEVYKSSDKRLCMSEIDAIMIIIYDKMINCDTANYTLFGMSSGLVLDNYNGDTRESIFKSESFARTKVAAIDRHCNVVFNTANFNSRLNMLGPWISDCNILLGDSESDIIDDSYASFNKIFSDVLVGKASVTDLMIILSDINKLENSNALLADYLEAFGFISEESCQDLVAEFIRRIKDSANILSGNFARGCKTSGSRESKLVAGHILLLFKIFVVAYSYDILNGVKFKAIEYVDNGSVKVGTKRIGNLNLNMLTDMVGVNLKDQDFNNIFTDEDIRSNATKISEEALAHFTDLNDFREYTIKNNIYGFYNHAVELFSDCNKVTSSLKANSDLKAKTEFMRQFLVDFRYNLVSKQKFYTMLSDSSDKVFSKVLNKLYLGDAML